MWAVREDMADGITVDKNNSVNVSFAFYPFSSVTFKSLQNLRIVTVKLKFTLAQATKAQRGSRCISTLSLTSALDVDGWSKPRPGRFTRGNDQVPVV